MLKVLILTFLFPLVVSSQTTWQDYTRISLQSSHVGLTDGDEFWVLAHVSLLKPRWYTYWFNPGDSGSNPKFTWESNLPIKIEGPFYPTPSRHESSGLVAFAYEGEVKFPFRIKLKARPENISVLILRLKAEWLVCDDVCIPAIDEQEIKVKIDGRTQLSRLSKEIDEVVGTLPILSSKSNLKLNKDQAILTVVSGLNQQQIKSAADFFPNPDFEVVLKKPRFTESRDRLGLQFEKNEKSPPAGGVPGGLLVFSQSQDKIPSHWYGFTPQISDVEATLATPRLVEMSSQGLGLLMGLLGAFFGGLLLNLMPCVFPILSLKVFSVLKSLGHQETTRQLKKDTIAYSLGILSSFVSLGIGLIILQKLGLQLGWGFQLQSAGFLVFLILLFHALALNMAGFFELQILTVGQPKMKSRSSFAGSFLTGVLAVVVASPCSAPFMGAAIGYALSQSPLVVISIFMSLGLGLAAPYIAIAYIPALASRIPRPGAWMNTFKQFMVYPLYLTAIWLLWVLGQVGGSSLIILVLLLALLLTPLFLVRDWRIMFMMFIPYLVTAVGSFHFVKNFETQSVKSNDSQAALQLSQLKKTREQAIFVNFTADWCLSCKVNERLIFKTEAFKKLLEKHDVKYVVIDWTRREDSITEFLKKYDRAGVPLYLLYPSGDSPAKVLPELLTLATLETEFALMNR